MTRKHYRAIAGVISKVLTDKAQDEGKPDQVTAIVWGIADIMAKDNPLFNRDKFILASGIKGDRQGHDIRD